VVQKDTPEYLLLIRWGIWVYLIVKEYDEYESRFGKKGDVNPGYFEAPIGIW